MLTLHHEIHVKHKTQGVLNCYTNITLMFQGNNTYLQPTASESDNDGLKKLFKLLSTMFNSLFTSPKQQFSNKVTFP